MTYQEWLDFMEQYLEDSYQSSYTGTQIDEAIAIARLLRSTSNAAANKILSISSVDGNDIPTGFSAVTPSGGSGNAVNIASITIAYANWSGNGPYTQTVTISGATITSDTKVDLQPDAAAIGQLVADGVQALYIVNTNGTLTAYAIGSATTADLTIQCTYYETV